VAVCGWSGLSAPMSTLRLTPRSKGIACLQRGDHAV
jgi:hypothetical protein